MVTDSKYVDENTSTSKENPPAACACFATIPAPQCRIIHEYCCFEYKILNVGHCHLLVSMLH